MALVAGVKAIPGKVMGHAGAQALRHTETALYKIKLLEEAGAIITDHPAKFGNIMRDLLHHDSKRPLFSADTTSKSHQLMARRGLHTATRTLRRPSSKSQFILHSRSFRLPRKHILEILEDYGLGCIEATTFWKISVNRVTFRPQVVFGNVSGCEGEVGQLTFDFPYDATPAEFEDALIEKLHKQTGTDNAVVSDLESCSKDDVSYIQSLVAHAWKSFCLFKDKEISCLMIYALYLGEEDSEGRWRILGADATFDSSAFRSSKRQDALYKNRDTLDELPAALVAEEFGIVYHRLAGDGNIGTLGKTA